MATSFIGGSALPILLLVLALSVPPSCGGSRSNDAYLPRNQQREGRTFQYQAQISPTESEPDPTQKVFYTRDSCAEACMVGCKVMMAQDDKYMYICSKVRPLEKSLKERILSSASSWPWVLFLAALIIAFTCCCGCLLWSCCCRRSAEAELEREDVKVGSSREPLATSDGRRIEELIPSQQSRPLLLPTNGTRIADNQLHVANNSRPINSSSNNNSIIEPSPHVRLSTGSKYVADV